jgi:PBP1b-binding outer membrane lipoprotein LpoB
MKRKIVSYCLLLSIVVLFNGCFGDSNVPSSSEVKKLILKEITPQTGKALELSNFEKINGYPSENGTYIATMKFDVLYKKSLKEIKEESLMSRIDANVYSMVFGKIIKNKTYTRQLDYKLRKTENGWVLVK